jgi:hypothetical protein
MTFPAIVFGIVLSTAFGTAFHFVKGGSLFRLFLYIFLSWMGFLAGHFIGAALDWSFAAVGPLNAGMATIGSFVFLFVGEWLGRVEITKK